MHAMNRRAARTAARSLVVPLAAGLLWAATPSAAAHTELISSNPKKAASLDRLPQTVRLTFSDEMSQKYAKVAVTAPGDNQGGAGEPEVVGKTVTLAVKPGLSDGRYTVGYRVVSADGHPVSGSYTFTVKQAVQAPVTSARPSPTSTGSTPLAGARSGSPQTGSDSASSGPSPLVLGISGALVAVGAGSGAILVRRRRARHGN